VLHQVFEGLAGKVSDPKEQVAVGVFVGDGAPQQGDRHPKAQKAQVGLRDGALCGILDFGCNGLRHCDQLLSFEFPDAGRPSRPAPSLIV
jgi:hypothetical protein